MHAFGISGIMADVGREEVKERSNDISGGAQAGGGSGYDRPSIKERPSWLSEAWIQMLVGNNLGEEGHSYNRANHMKLCTGIVEDVLDFTNADQDKTSSRFKEVHLWQTPPEILYSIPIDIRTSWNKFHALKQCY